GLSAVNCGRRWRVLTDRAMRAIVVRGDAHDLEWTEVPDPTAVPGAVVVKVHATAVNRADLLQRRGFYPPPPGQPEPLGLEAAGREGAGGVGVVGGGVQIWKIGDRVCCLLGGGGYAQRVAVAAGMLLPIPPQLDFEQAAAVPEVFYTAFVNLVLEGELGPNE